MADVEAPLTGGSPSGNVSIGQRVSQTLQVFGISLILGFFVGFGLKVNFMSILLLLILVVVVTQLASCYGIMTVHWKEVRSACKNCLDQDGNGKLDCDDCRMFCAKSFGYALAVGFGLIIGFVCAWYFSSKLSKCG
ncbi:hypothetical protein BSKO_04933 [Bryopsis sp. KO-2023]|nr:hypothetical protein BSKO_04933 [Bryopsis sp. KO-2023]